MRRIRCMAQYIMNCKQCGNPLMEQEKFCSFCGADVSELTRMQKTEWPNPTVKNDAMPSFETPPQTAYGYTQVPPNMPQYSNYVPQTPPQKKKYTGLIVFLIILGILILAMIVGFVFLMYMIIEEEQESGQISPDSSLDFNYDSNYWDEMSSIMEDIEEDVWGEGGYDANNDEQSNSVSSGEANETDAAEALVAAECFAASLNDLDSDLMLTLIPEQAISTITEAYGMEIAEATSALAPYLQDSFRFDEDDMGIYYTVQDFSDWYDETELESLNQDLETMGCSDAEQAVYIILEIGEKEIYTETVEISFYYADDTWYSYEAIGFLADACGVLKTEGA